MTEHFKIMLKHHNISRSRTVVLDGTLAQAKRRALKEFGDEQRDYRIEIWLHEGSRPWMVCTRYVGGGKWQPLTSWLAR